MKIKLLVASSLVSISLISATPIVSAGEFDKQIEARQAIFKLYSYNMGILGAMAKGKTEYNADTAAEAAKNLSSLSKLGQTTLWPAGSDNSNSDNKTRALPAIWESYPEILEKFTAMQEAAAALEAEAGNGLDAMKAKIGEANDGCKSCHRGFRARKN